MNVEKILQGLPESETMNVDKTVEPYNASESMNVDKTIIPTVEDQPNVYMFSGHACDITHEDKKIIPPGCYYITLELCGYESNEFPKMIYAFTDKRSKISQYLKNPFSEDSLSYMVKYFEVGDGTDGTLIHVHGPGEEYIDSRMFFFMDVKGYNSSILVFKSGLYELSSPPTNFEKINSFVKEFPRNSPVTYDDFQDIYKNSKVKPTNDIVSSLYGKGDIPTIETVKKVLESGSLRLSESFKHSPGIYYNFACRVECRAETKRAAELRENSLRKLKRFVLPKVSRYPSRTAQMKALMEWKHKKNTQRGGESYLKKQRRITKRR